ncbi:MAG: MerR family transcriptional regulator [Planctomycetota bacterium]
MTEPDRETGSSGVKPPEKLYSTGELMAHTGLSRQTLHNYKSLGLIKPVRWTDGGHAYYDESVFERIHRIKKLQRHRPLKEIRELLDVDGETTGDEPADMPADTPAAQPADTAAIARDIRDGQAPRQLYRIGDVMRITGFSRQTLHNYTIQGLLQTRDATDSGHRLYGDDVFQSLRLIEIYKRHRRFDEVQKLIEEWRRFGHPRATTGRVVQSLDDGDSAQDDGNDNA